MNDFKKVIIKRIDNLFTIKSIVTIGLLFLFGYLNIRGVNNEQVNNVFLMVVSFYFGTKFGKE